MANGAELAITQGLKLAMRAAGLKPEQVEQDVVKLVNAVLTWDARLAAIEQNQLLILRHMGIFPMEAIGNGKDTASNGTDERDYGHG